MAAFVLVYYMFADTLFVSQRKLMFGDYLVSVFLMMNVMLSLMAVIARINYRKHTLMYTNFSS